MNETTKKVVEQLSAISKQILNDWLLDELDVLAIHINDTLKALNTENVESGVEKCPECGDDGVVEVTVFGVTDYVKCSCKGTGKVDEPTDTGGFQTILCAAFCGAGKSYLSKNQPDKYRELECWEYRKGNFPANYIQAIVGSLGKSEYLFISADPVVLKELDALGIEDILLAYPENKLRNEYLDRYIERNSPFDLIGVLMINWNTWIDALKEQSYCKHIVLKSGEYLQSRLSTNTDDMEAAFKKWSHTSGSNWSPYSAWVTAYKAGKESQNER